MIACQQEAARFAALVGNHAMFADPAAARMIRMCDNCRVQAQFHAENNPFTGKARPPVRTTQDYLCERIDPADPARAPAIKPKKNDQTEKRRLK